MNGSAIRSGRIQQLRKMRLNGKSWDDLRRRCLEWGVSATTAKSYLDAVEGQLNKMRERLST